MTSSWRSSLFQQVYFFNSLAFFFVVFIMNVYLISWLANFTTRYSLTTIRNDQKALMEAQ